MPSYRTFGLCVDSDIDLPELTKSADAADANVVVGDIKDFSAPPVGYAAEHGLFDLSVPGVARFRVEGGVSIIVCPEDGVDEASVRLFLLGSAFGALLHQRGVLPIHGAAVRSPEGYVIVAGPSGAGKSSLAAALVARGWPMASDDISAVRLSEGLPVLDPGYPESKVWPDSLLLLGDEPDAYETIRPNIEKRRVPVRAFSDEIGPVAAVVRLLPTGCAEPSARRLSGGAAMALLKRQVYRPAFSLPLGVHADHFATIAALASTAPVVVLERPRTRYPLDDLAGFLQEQLASDLIA